MKDAIAVAIELLPLFFKWVQVALEGGQDPRAELDAMMGTAEAQARELERAKFG